MAGYSVGDALPNGETVVSVDIETLPDGRTLERMEDTGGNVTVSGGAPVGAPDVVDVAALQRQVAVLTEQLAKATTIAGVRTAAQAAVDAASADA